MYALKDNKCREDITDRTPNITTLADLGYPDANYALEHIIETNMNDKGILVYSVSNVTNTNVYPVKVPADDFAIVVITKTSGVATISFHFYDSFYINHYSYEQLAGWIKVGKTELSTIEFRNIPSGYIFDHVEDLSVYGNIDNAHVNVTLLTENSFIGDKPKIDFIYYVKYGNLYLHCKNNGSSSLASVKFNICII